MIKIYAYGCITCGINGIYIRKIQAYGVANDIPVEVINSRYEEAGRLEHAELLKSKSYDVDSYQPIVVYNGEVRRLRSWNL